MSRPDRRLVSDADPVRPDPLVRLAVGFVALVLGAVAAGSVVGFVFNLTIDYPGTGRRVIAVDPLWMLGHVIRGVGLGVVTYRLWRYQAALKHWHVTTGEGSAAFLRAQAAAWKAGAVVLALLTIYGVVYVMFGGVRP